MNFLLECATMGPAHICVKVHSGGCPSRLVAHRDVTVGHLRGCGGTVLCLRGTTSGRRQGRLHVVTQPTGKKKVVKLEEVFFYFFVCPRRTSFPLFLLAVYVSPRGNSPPRRRSRCTGLCKYGRGNCGISQQAPRSPEYAGRMVESEKTSGTDSPNSTRQTGYPASSGQAYAD